MDNKLLLQHGPEVFGLEYSVILKPNVGLKKETEKCEGSGSVKEETPEGSESKESKETETRETNEAKETMETEEIQEIQEIKEESEESKEPKDYNEEPTEYNEEPRKILVHQRTPESAPLFLEDNKSSIETSTSTEKKEENDGFNEIEDGSHVIEVTYNLYNAREEMGEDESRGCQKNKGAVNMDIPSTPIEIIEVDGFDVNQITEEKAYHVDLTPDEIHGVDYFRIPDMDLGPNHNGLTEVSEYQGYVIESSDNDSENESSDIKKKRLKPAQKYGEKTEHACSSFENPGIVINNEDELFGNFNENPESDLETEYSQLKSDQLQDEGLYSQTKNELGSQVKGDLHFSQAIDVKTESQEMDLKEESDLETEYSQKSDVGESQVKNESPPAPESSFVVPDSALKLSVTLSVNGRKKAQDSEFFRMFAGSLRESLIWPELMYTLSKSQEVSNFEQSLILKCDLFNPILDDMKHVENLQYLKEIRLDFEYWSPNSSVMAEDLFDKLQYLMTSFLINMEFKYPFVFSYFGRRLFRINYATSLRTVAIFGTPLDNSSAPDRHQVLELVLRKFQNAILYEFNTLNVMKECDMKYHRAVACRKYMVSQKKSDRISIKSTAYDMRVLKEEFEHS